MPRWEATSSTEDAIGTLVANRYRLTDVLGRGATSVVYGALHEALGQRVALKVLGNGWTEDQAARRFVREARAATSIGHPHIVRVHDLGNLPDGRPYIVMERLSGSVLSRYAAEPRPLSPRSVARLLAGVGSALDAVHARGIVHRDIKPENIFVEHHDDGTHFVKVLDFGLAHSLHPHRTRLGERVTEPGIITGTPHFMAPECLDERTPDHRADIYALAVVAYELLTSRVPFDGKKALELLAAKRKDPAPPLAHAGGSFSPAVEAVIARGLAIAPSERHPTAGAFVHDLCVAADGFPVHPSTAAFLDLAAGERRHPTPPVRPRPLARVPAGRLLVIDEDPAVRALVRASLEPFGFRVVGAGPGASAVAAIEHALPDAILLGVEGDDACASVDTLHRMAPRVPVIVVSSSSVRPPCDAPRAPHVLGTLRKPLDPFSLARTVGQLLEAP